MTAKSEFKNHWRSVAEGIAQGTYELTQSDLLAIADNVDVLNLVRSDMTGFMINNSSDDARKLLFQKISANVLGKTPEYWLRKEKFWLKKIKEATGKVLPACVKYPGTTLSSEILVRIIATALFVKKVMVQNSSFSSGEKNVLVFEAVLSLNLFLSEICAKGRCNTKIIGNWAISVHLEGHSVITGYIRNDGLPYPEIILPELFFMLHKDNIPFGAYLK